MLSISQTLQIVVALSVFYVWTFRINNVVREFELFGLTEIERSLIGASKVVLSTLLFLGIWLPNLVFVPAILMAGFMLGAQYYHYKIKDPIKKYIPSLVFLVCSAVIAYLNSPFK